MQITLVQQVANWASACQLLLLLLFGARLVAGQNSSNVVAAQSDMLLGAASRVGADDKQAPGAHSLASSMLRSFIRTNNMRAYHLDLHSYRKGAEEAGNAAHLVKPRLEHYQTCSKHLLIYHRLLAELSRAEPTDGHSSLDALKLADTYGRTPAGLLEGNQFWLGSYDTCGELKISAPHAEPLSSQYCIGVAQYPSWNPRDTKTSIKVGLCLPDTCTNTMVNKGESSDGRPLIELVEQMMKFQFGAHEQRLKLRSIYCLPHETSQIRQLSLSANLLIALLGAFVSIVLYATIYDCLNSKLEREKNELVARRQILTQPKRSARTIFIESFSLIRNIEKLMKVSLPTAQTEQNNENNNQTDQNEFKFNQQTLSGSITGLKCLGLIWIIAAHTFLVSPIPHNNLVSIDKLTTTLVANIYLSAHLMVDTFFALSGLLASYLLFKSGLDRMKSTDWLALTVHRYWRLTPVYLICYWFTKSLGHQLNSGPLWDYGTAEQSPRYKCQQESWSEALLHMSDFKSPKEHCVPFAWFIANGIKFWIVTPFILISIHKSMRRGYLSTIALILANVWIVAKLAFNSNVDMKSVIEFRPESAENMLNNMDQVYTRPYSRIGAYLVGLLAGHVFYRIETKQLEIKLSKNTQILLWTLFAVTTIVLTFVLKLANGLPLDDSAIPYIFSFSSALIRPLWALCSCWLVFALAHGQARWLSKFLSANIWKILVKLSFCAYLAQGEVIAHLYLSQTQSSAFTYADLITRPIVSTVLTMLASIVMLLFIEYPLIGIEELVLPVKRQHQKTSEPANAEATKLVRAHHQQQQQKSEPTEERNLFMDSTLLLEMRKRGKLIKVS